LTHLAWCGLSALATSSGFSHEPYSVLRLLKIKVRFILASEPQDTLEYSSYSKNFSVTVSPSNGVGRNYFESIFSIYISDLPIKPEYPEVCSS
jgi:hypothetical protein